MRAIAVPLLAVVVAGCAAELDVSGSKWTKSGTSFNQVTLDVTDCARGALNAGTSPVLVVGGLLDIGRDVIRERGREGAYEKCMKDRGYQIARR